MQDLSWFRAYSNTKGLRSGKWTTKEEQYARSVIQAYGLGLLDLPTGEQSLRSYLAKKLHCSPSRITKKFKGQAPMNILDAQRLCRSRLREGRCRTSQERAETMKALGILEREFLMEIALMQEANATTPVAHDGLSPLTASPDKSPTHQWYHPQIYSPTVLSSPCGGSTSTAPFVTSPIWPHPPPTQNNDDLLQMSLTLNNVLSSLLQSTCAANRLGSSMMSQRQANLAPRPGTNIFEQQLNCPENRSQRASKPANESCSLPSQLSPMDLLCNVAESAVPLNMDEHKKLD